MSGARDRADVESLFHDFSDDVTSPRVSHILVKATTGSTAEHRRLFAAIRMIATEKGAGSSQIM